MGRKGLGGGRGDWVGELMGDSRKKRRSSPPLVLGSQRTRAGGVALRGGASRRFLSGRAVLHKPLPSLSGPNCPRSIPGGGLMALARPSGPRGVRLRLILLGCLRRLGSGCDLGWSLCRDLTEWLHPVFGYLPVCGAQVMACMCSLASFGAKV